jgi:hypothetical protein
MSINAMNTAVIARRARTARLAAEVAGAPAPAQAAETKPPATALLNELVRFIPTELITLYVAFLGVATVTNGDYTARWWGFGIFTLATGLAAIVDWKIKQRPLRQLERTRVPRFSVVAAIIAFAAWGFALPGTPFQELSWYDTKWAGFAALVVSYVLGKSAALFGPEDQRPA